MDKVNTMDELMNCFMRLQQEVIQKQDQMIQDIQNDVEEACDMIDEEEFVDELCAIIDGYDRAWLDVDELINEMKDAIKEFEENRAAEC